MTSIFLQRVYWELCRRILTEPGNKNASFINGQIDEAKHQLELAQKKIGQRITQ